MNICSERMKKINSEIRGANYQYALQLEKNGEKVLKLNTGNPAAFGFEMPESVKKAIIDNIDKTLGYTDVRGMADAREAIYKYHKDKGIHNFTIDDIFIGNGVSEIASMVCSALFSSNDEVLVPSPCYSLWNNEILLRDAKPVFYRCSEKDGWEPDTKHIKSLVNSRTKAVLIINPNNPTGALYSDEVLSEIIDIARENKLVVLSDEIYDRLVFDGKTHTSVASLSDDVPTITMNGLSKSHCLCGIRCGWLAVSGDPGKRSCINEALLKIASIRLSANSVMQTVIPAALDDTAYTQKLVSPGGRLYEQRKAACEEMDKISELSYVKNSAAFYVFPKINTPIPDDKAFAHDLLVQKHILIVPGSGFSYGKTDHFRIVMLPEPDVLRNAISEIHDLLSC